MNLARFVILLSATLLGACASSDPPPRHQSFGPPNMGGMSPTSGMGSFQGAPNMGSGNQPFRTGQPIPTGFKGF